MISTHSFDSSQTALSKFLTVGQRILAICISMYFSCISLSVHAEAEHDCAALGMDFTSIELQDGISVPVHRGLNGKRYIYIFPMKRTEVTFIEGEPYITVYRGIRGQFDPNMASSNKYSEEEVQVFGFKQEPGRFADYIFTSLSPKVAIGYLTRVSLITFTTPKHLTLVKVRLPVKKAYVAKRPKFSSEQDVYIPALANRSYIWYRWRAPERRKERELVWNLQELGGSLNDPRFDLNYIEVPVEVEPSTGKYESLNNWGKARDLVKQLYKTGKWNSASTLAPN